MIDKIEPVILFVRNFKECKSFYKEKVGLKEENYSTEENANFLTFKLSNISFSLHGGFKGTQSGPINIHFVTDNIEKEVMRLKNSGVRFVREIENVPWGGKEASFVDPDGNEMDLYEPA